MLSYRPNVDKCFFWKYKRKVSHFARISSLPAHFLVDLSLLGKEIVSMTF